MGRRDWQNFEERPRKVHLYHDQQGAEHAPGRKYTNTLCKGNFNHDGLLFTDDPTKVTCQSCLKKIRRSRRAFGVINPSTATPVITIHASSIRYRQTLRGKLVLQIKERQHVDGNLNDPIRLGWVEQKLHQVGVVAAPKWYRDFEICFEYGSYWATHVDYEGEPDGEGGWQSSGMRVECRTLAGLREEIDAQLEEAV